MSTTSTVLVVEQSTPARSERFEIDRHRASVLDTESDRAQVPVYSRFTNAEKRGITALLAFCGVLATMSTTSIFAAIPEIVQEYKTTATIVNMSGAIYLVFMGLSSCIWGPAADIFGRRKSYLCSTILFFAFSLGTALSPTLASFFVCRAFTAAQGTAFLILGSSCISDIYHPTERATSLGWFLAGTMFGPAFGPVIGGIVVTYKSWRIIFWMQTSMTGVAVLLTYFLLQETSHNIRASNLKGQGFTNGAKRIWRWANPVTVFKLYACRNLLFVTLASSALVWNMYSLLTPVRYVLNPRLHLTTPLQSGMLYISPGVGYVIGVQIGGRWSDYTVKQWIKKRGYRLPEDRLRSCLLFLGLLLPASMIIYGWMIDKHLGGIPVPVICMFFQGIAQLAAFPSLNAYILDVMQHRSGEASASHYMMRYSLAGVATALCMPMFNHIGVGWMSTVSASLLLVSTTLVYWTIRSGKSWRDAEAMPVEE
ncbi:hypothetical protein FOCG_05192 [Fusarium oxysporum f. sp. radicis-lycopersici 26381]|uniref:Major facilitator superfamily (MFS) profile domain-containing protein n=1 Tax=Fusarium oxysporum Fo47 TaxID=660027 RepID=W9KBP2_FUSOX|nr:major facilitator superfamily domain-containing protein [Fusarium oxysporum Fo47]EWZ38803.1 hypothetical protein FOZG_10338 [Fusarium oxysporum Fo47]EXL58254.1 hypothetical protein FOCG_05192 [Fusarium oxysporum f. sp. radicis-lycopersici 26381]WJG35418.1 major facilitator superfamily domain-containing protein [Fusarium oxysporum Fo47]